MLHHRTTDPAYRAWHVAAREFRVQYILADYTHELLATLATYEQCLWEFAEAAQAAKEE
jgi:hypothetical protein